MKTPNDKQISTSGWGVQLIAVIFLLGPNGVGKTAALQAMSRLFDFNPAQRRIRRTDFHLSAKQLAEGYGEAVTLWIEAQFEFPELLKADQQYATISGNFARMRLASPDGIPRVRVRLTATMAREGEIEETLVYVLQADASEEPSVTEFIPKPDRNSIQVHYLPARRDPTDHISYAAGSLLGRALRAASWKDQAAVVAGLPQDISNTLAGNAAALELDSISRTIGLSCTRGPTIRIPTFRSVAAKLTTFFAT